MFLFILRSKTIPIQSDEVNFSLKNMSWHIHNTPSLFLRQFVKVNNRLADGWLNEAETENAFFFHLFLLLNVSFHSRSLLGLLLKIVG